MRAALVGNNLSPAHYIELVSQSRWLSNITFHLQSIWLQDLVVVDSESCQTSFPSVCVPPSVQFESEQTPSCLTSRQLRSCTGFGSEFTELFLCHIFTLRPINDRKIERSDARCFGRQQPLACALHRKFHLSLKKSDLSRPNIYKALKYFWLSNWVSIARVVAVQ